MKNLQIVSAMAVAAALTGSFRSAFAQSAPGTPGNLRVISAGDTQAVLNWTAPAFGSPVGYNLYRCVSGNGVQPPAACTPARPRSLGNATTFTDTSLTPGSIYTYQVAAVGAGGESAPSNPVSASTTQVGIAAGYSGDVGIENNPNVSFVDRFAGTIASITSRYSDSANTNAMSILSDRPANSPDQSILLYADGIEGDTPHLYRNLDSNAAGTDAFFLRYYVRYQANGHYHHSAVWMGGYDPATPWPYPRAGCLPSSDPTSGNELFSVGFEPGAFNWPFVPGTSRFDSYIYWMGMGGDKEMDCDATFACPGPNGVGVSVAPNNQCFWGNQTICPPEVNPTACNSIMALTDNWRMVEMMIKLNDDLSASTGEIAIWVDGVKVADEGPNFPLGTWNTSNLFTAGAGGTAFSGFQFRNTGALPINFLWIQNDSSYGTPTNMQVANLVVSKTYVGPLGSGTPTTNILSPAAPRGVRLL